MAIQFFDENPSISGDLEFAAEYLKSHPKDVGKAFPITEITLAKSGKGYMAKTDMFLCWLWKREQTTTLLLAALQTYTEQRYGYAIVAVLDKGNKSGYRLGVDADLPCMWYGSGKKYTNTPDTPTLETKDGNPFLILPAPCPPTMSMTESETLLETSPHTSNGKKKSVF